MKNFKKEEDLFISQIKAERDQSAKEVSSHLADTKTLLDAKTMIIENGEMGVLSTDVIIRLVKESPTDQIRGVNTLLNYMKEGVKINTSGFPSTDKNGIEYYWIKLFSRTGLIEMRVNNFEGLDDLLHGYLRGEYSVQTNLEQLYKEAISQ
ncbi:MAG: hypothetical protein WKF66_02215 [Pedobacter sp.]